MQILVDAASRVKEDPVWSVADNLRKDLNPLSFRQLLQQCSGTPHHEALVAGFASEWPLSRDGRLVLTPFYMISGRQKFLDTIRTAANLTLSDAGSPEKVVEEALFGPWRYQDELSSLGWDPATERYHALEAEAPTKSSPRAVRAAVWLAAESLALYPCFGVGRRVHTPGVSASGFYWPVWEMPITYFTLRSLMNLPLFDLDAKDELVGRGVSAVFVSQRGVGAAGHGYYSFRPATLLWQT